MNILVDNEQILEAESIKKEFFNDANKISEKIKFFGQKFKDVDFKISLKILYGNLIIAITRDISKYIDFDDDFNNLSDEIKNLSIDFRLKWKEAIGEIDINPDKTNLEVRFVLLYGEIVKIVLNK